MRYLIKSRDRIYIKGYGFLSFAENVGKNLSNKYSQKLLHTAKKSITDTIKTALKRVIQKTAEATVDLIGNKIADKTTNVSKKHKTVNQKQIMTVKRTYQKRDIYLQKKDNKLLMN